MRLRLRQLIDTLNRHRTAANLPVVSDRSIAQAAGVNKETFHRLTQNTRPGAVQFLDVLDRIMDVLSDVAGREITPADVIERVPNKRGGKATPVLTTLSVDQKPPARPPGRRPKPAKE